MPNLRLRNLALLALATLSVASPPAQVPQKEKKAQTQAAASPAQPASTTPHDLTTADLDAFFDGMIPAQIAREDIAGAVIAVVKDGKVIYERGYGYADVKSKKPVTADATLFRPGSITKLFTWTAVMQLVEQGKLDLDTDVNTYLDFKIRRKFGKPITLRNIMTHTGGFEESIKDLIQKDTAVMPLRDYLAEPHARAHLPARRIRRLLQLRDLRRRIHRAARLRRKIRRLHRPPHLPAAEHAALHHGAAPARQSQRPDVVGLRQGLRR